VQRETLLDPKAGGRGYSLLPARRAILPPACRLARWRREWGGMHPLPPIHVTDAKALAVGESTGRGR